jgi:putative oxidoreductase
VYSQWQSVFNLRSGGTQMNLARVLMRTTVGGLFVGHGTQKLFGWFGGGGVEGTAQVFDHLGLHPPRRTAVAAGVSETAGGALLFLGLATPLAAATLTSTMLTAIRRVHLANGPWVSKGGYEYNLVMIAAALVLAEDGPGQPSLDAALGIERKGTGWALAAAAGGALGAFGVHQLSEAARRRNAGQSAGAAEQPPTSPAASAADNGGESLPEGDVRAERVSAERAAATSEESTRP